MLILVDSSSSHTFLSSILAGKLSGMVSLHQPLSVKVASGSSLSCTSHIRDASWETQGLRFSSNLKILPLQHFDMVLGYDWLESFSPMKIHWSEKWLSIPYGNTTVIIQGILSEIKVGSVVQICQLTEEDLDLDTSEETTKLLEVPPEIQQLLSTYVVVFATKVAFPPPRSCCHTIPMIPGVRPVYVRPYRYAPTLKDEIESQVQDMLTTCFIQHNTSSFSSPVLLVKKKDHTYRFCVDYR
jgi:hypothetical protein